MQCIERAKSKFSDVTRSICFGRLWNDDFIRERQERLSVTAPARIRIAAHFEIQDRAAHPDGQPFANQSHNLLDRFRLGAHA
jgi:hypothetical protein